jgi:hypothetical protein
MRVETTDESQKFMFHPTHIPVRQRFNERPVSHPDPSRAGVLVRTTKHTLTKFRYVISRHALRICHCHCNKSGDTHLATTKGEEVK